MGKEREDGVGSPRRGARRRPQRGATLRRRGRGEAPAVDRRGEAAMGENCAGDRRRSWRENWATGEEKLCSGRGNRAQLAKKTARGRFLLWKIAQAFRFGRNTVRKLLTRGPGWSGSGAGRPRARGPGLGRGWAGVAARALGWRGGGGMARWAAAGLGWAAARAGPARGEELARRGKRPGAGPPRWAERGGERGGRGDGAVGRLGQGRGAGLKSAFPFLFFFLLFSIYSSLTLCENK
jgi:hypothetical protein